MNPTNSLRLPRAKKSQEEIILVRAVRVCKMMYSSVRLVGFLQDGLSDPLNLTNVRPHYFKLSLVSV